MATGWGFFLEGENKTVSLLSVIVPCYNEEEMLPITAKELMKKMDALMDEGRISRKSRVMFVDDGSKDATWEIIEKLHGMQASDIFTGVSSHATRAIRTLCWQGS